MCFVATLLASWALFTVAGVIMFWRSDFTDTSWSREAEVGKAPPLDYAETGASRRALSSTIPVGFGPADAVKQDELDED